MARPIKYVDVANGDDVANGGTSWNDAWATIQKAFTTQTSGMELHIGAGRYNEGVTNNPGGDGYAYEVYGHGLVIWSNAAGGAECFLQSVVDQTFYKFFNITFAGGTYGIRFNNINPDGEVQQMVVEDCIFSGLDSAGVRINAYRHAMLWFENNVFDTCDTGIWIKSSYNDDYNSLWVNKNLFRNLDYGVRIQEASTRRINTLGINLSSIRYNLFVNVTGCVHASGMTTTNWKNASWGMDKHIDWNHYATCKNLIVIGTGTASFTGESVAELQDDLYADDVTEQHSSESTGEACLVDGSIGLYGIRHGSLAAGHGPYPMSIGYCSGVNVLDWREWKDSDGKRPSEETSWSFSWDNTNKGYSLKDIPVQSGNSAQLWSPLYHINDPTYGNASVLTVGLSITNDLGSGTWSLNNAKNTGLYSKKTMEYRYSTSPFDPMGDTPSWTEVELDHHNEAQIATTGAWLQLRVTARDNGCWGTSLSAGHFFGVQLMGAAIVGQETEPDIVEFPDPYGFDQLPG